MNQVLEILKSKRNARTILEIMDTFESKEPTTALVNSKDLTDQFRITDERLLLFANSWFAPNDFFSGKEIRAVNPHYPHRWKFSDVIVECDCGAVMGAGNSYYDWFEGEHSDECTPLEYHKAKHELWKNRKEIFTKAALGYRRPEYLSYRMALAENNLSGMRKRLNHNGAQVRHQVRDDIIDEILPVLRPELSRADVARILDVAPSTISRWSKEDYRAKVNARRAEADSD